MYSLDNIYKSFDNNQVLKGVSLEIPKNKTTVLIGPSGSGKTTLLRCINLLEIPDSGTVNVNGSSMTFHEGQKVKYSSNEIRNIRMKTGMVFQNFQLFPHKTVLENIMEGPITVLKKDRSECEKEALSLLEKVGLSDKRDAYPGQLSGGQQQRIATHDFSKKLRSRLVSRRLRSNMDNCWLPLALYDIFRHHPVFIYIISNLKYCVTPPFDLNVTFWYRPRFPFHAPGVTILRIIS